jgi:hypothetical protein
MMHAEDESRFNAWLVANTAQANVAAKGHNYDIPTRPTKIALPSKSFNKNACGLKLHPGETSCPIARGDVMDINAVHIVDTGATYDVGGRERTTELYPTYIRELLKSINFKTHGMQIKTKCLCASLLT